MSLLPPPARPYRCRFRYVCPGCGGVLLAGFEPLVEPASQQAWKQDFPNALFLMMETATGLVVLSRAHSHGDHQRINPCPYMLPRGIDAPTPDPAGDLYRTLYQLAFHGDPLQRIVAFDVAKFLALPCWVWTPDTEGQGAPLALVPATIEGLALRLLLGEEPALLDIDPHRSQLQQLAVAFPARIGATLA